MYVGRKLCYLAGDTKRDPKHLFSHTTSYPRRLTLPASPPFYHPDLLLSSPHSSDFITISYVVSPRIQNSSRYLQPRNSQLLTRHIAWPTWEFIRRNYAYEFVLDEVLGCRLSRKFLNGCLELLRC